MKKYLIVLLLMVSVSLVGCDYIKNMKYKGKVFKIRAEIEEEDKVKILTWENANNVSFDKEEHIYTFHVNGKLVVVDPRGAVIIEEQ
jgi:outer membrane lipoprotein SlyB